MYVLTWLGCRYKDVLRAELPCRELPDEVLVSNAGVRARGEGQLVGKTLVVVEEYGAGGEQERQANQRHHNDPWLRGHGPCYDGPATLASSGLAASSSAAPLLQCLGSLSPPSYNKGYFVRGFRV